VYKFVDTIYLFLYQLLASIILLVNILLAELK